MCIRDRDRHTPFQAGREIRWPCLSATTTAPLGSVTVGFSAGGVVMVRLRAVGVVAAAALLAACTAPWQPDGDRTPTASPTATPPPPVYQAELQLPEAPATVIEGADPATLAAGVSATLFASAPVAVLASAVDSEAHLRAASAAVALGAPLLLHDPGAGVAEPSTGATTGATADPAAAAPPDVTADELSRLGVLAILVFGDVDVPVERSVTVVQAPADDRH